MRLIMPSEYRSMPWKNGGGTTWEVAIHPPAADWESFLWRISIAEIARDGDFSSLAGIDRVLVVLAGNGMALTGAGDRPIEMRPHDCVAFAGEAHVRSRLLDGPTRDFNVMTRRGAARASVRVVRDERAVMPAAGTYVCHAASRACACRVAGTTIDVGEACTLVSDTGTFEVDASGAVAIVAMVTH
jgi:environmental stress-induced protein Ves